MRGIHLSGNGGKTAFVNVSELESLAGQEIMIVGWISAWIERERNTIFVTENKARQISSTAAQRTYS